MSLLKEICLAFVIGGGLCLIGQLLFDVANLTPAHTMSILVVSGAILGGLGLYQPIADLAGMGGTLPIISFGNTLVKAAMAGAAKDGFWGIWTGMLKDVSAGISITVFMAVAVAMLFRPKA